MKQLTKDQIKEFNEEGYIQFKGLFDTEEIELLRSTAHADRELDKHSFSREDGEGGKVRLSLWNHPGDSIYGMFARSNRMVNKAEELLGEEVYHYHSKMILKKVDDSMIKQVGSLSFEEGAQTWLDPEKDESASGLDQG